jgi:hypothetical protein
LVGFTTGARVLAQLRDILFAERRAGGIPRRPPVVAVLSVAGHSMAAGSPNDDVDESVISEGEDCRWRIA